MNKNTLLTFSILLIFSCQSNETKKIQSENTVSKQKETAVFPVAMENLTLKNCIINETYFNEKTKIAKGLKHDEIESLNLNMIESINRDASAKIKIIDTLFTNQKGKIIVISQENENESTAFIVQVNDKNKAYAFESGFYADTVEYISSTSTKVTDKKIEINTETDNGEEKPIKSTVTFNFVNGKLIKG